MSYYFGLVRFFSFWSVNILALWVTDEIFEGIYFESFSSLLISALLFGFVNIWIKPILIIFTLPMTIFTLGTFIFIINSFLFLLVSWLVAGFFVENYFDSLFGTIFISIFLFFVNSFLGKNYLNIKTLK